MVIDLRKATDNLRKSVLDSRKLALDLRKLVPDLQKLVFDLRELMFFRKKEPVVGLDIDQERITVIGLQEIPQGLKLKHIGVSPTPSGAIENGVIVNTKELTKVIQELFATKQIKSKRVVSAIGGPGVLIHLSKVPSMSDSEMKEALKTEVAHYIVFAGSQTISDTHKLEEITEGGTRKNRVLLGVAKKEMVNSYVEAIKQAGLELVGIDIGSLAITRALYSNALKTSLTEPVILITVEFEYTGLSILQAGVLSYYHNVELGSKDMVKPEEFIIRLAPELESVIGYYQSEYGQKIKRIVLAGDIGKIEGLDRDLSTKFKGVDIEKGNPLKGIEYDQPGLSQEDRMMLAYSSRAIGLAMRGIGIGDYPVNINLLPVEEIKVKELKGQIKIFILSLGGLVFFLFLFFIALRLWIGSTAAKTIAIQEELKKPIPALGRLLGIEKGSKIYLDEIEKQKEITYEAHTKRWDGLLEEIKLIIPKEVRLTKLTDRENEVIFKGEATSQEAVFNFVRSLRESANFTEVKLHTAKDKKKRGQVWVDFDIRCRLVLKKSDEA